jgi:uncharacterized membrane protein YeiH
MIWRLIERGDDGGGCCVHDLALGTTPYGVWHHQNVALGCFCVSILTYQNG